MNSNIGERIKTLRKQQRMTQADLAEKIGVSKSTIAMYEISRNFPNVKMIKKLCMALNTTGDFLVGLSDSSQLPEPTITEEYTTFPVIGEVAAGYESVADENWIGDTVDIPLSYLQGHNRTDFFVLKVKGDSMYPLYHDADKVLVLKQSTMNYSGQIGVVIYGDDKGTIKRVEYSPGEDWMKLVPVNPNFPTVKIENEELEHCRVLGIPQLLIRDLKE